MASQPSAEPASELASPRTAELTAELALLRRQLVRERRARLTAEQVGERTTRELYETVQRLEEAQEQLRRTAEEQELLHELSRDIRRDLTSQGLFRRAVASVGAATGADRCLIRLAEGAKVGAIVEQWARPGVTPLSPDVPLPDVLQDLCEAAAHARVSLRIADIGADPRLCATDSSGIVAAIDAHSYLGAPMWVGEQLIGWLVLHMVDEPWDWTSRQLSITSALAIDLGVALMQDQAFRRQAEAVQHLEQVNQVKSELVSTVSHELRTPLTSISGYVELLRGGALGPLSGMQRHSLDVMSRNAQRLLNLIEDLLFLSRAETGVNRERREAVRLQDVMARADETLRPVASDSGLELSVEADEDLPTLPGDGAQLERVVLNLLSNAIKFSVPGGRVAAAATRVGDHVALTVTDTGIGIPPEDLPHVFERFYRSPDANWRAIQGTGLGLAVVKSIVEAHGGSVAIESSIGQGTVVRVTLPCTPGTSRRETDTAGGG